MKQLTINPNNEPYYSDDFIKGFECGTKRQFEADRPQDGEFENFDRESLILLIEAQKERIGELLANRPQEKTISVDVLREILSDVKETHRNNSEAEAVISDVWDEVADMLKGTDDERHGIQR